MSKIPVTVLIDEELYMEFSIIALKKFKIRRGFFSKAIEEAMRLWIEENKM